MTGTVPQIPSGEILIEQAVTRNHLRVETRFVEKDLVHVGDGAGLPRVDV